MPEAFGSALLSAAGTPVTLGLGKYFGLGDDIGRLLRAAMAAID